MGLLDRRAPRLIPGIATAETTRAYSHAHDLDPGHYSDFQGRVKLSAIGLGTFPGAADDVTDQAIADIVHKGLVSGLNVIDTAAHYRYGRSLAAIAAGLRRAWDDGVKREALWLMSKGGFVTFPGETPADPKAYIEAEIIAKGLGRREDCAGAHVLSPDHIRAQIEQSRVALGVETLDAFLVDQPEVHIPVSGKAALIDKLAMVFVALEEAVRDGAIAHYGVSSFQAFRVATDDTLFLSLASLMALAGKAAKTVTGSERDHHFAVIELPFNAVMLEGFSRFNQITGEGGEASTLQAALALNLYTVASHGLLKGHLARQSVDILVQAMPGLANDARRALQFNRSTPGLGTTLVGLSTPAHLEDVLAVARTPLLSHAAYMALYHRAEN